MLNPSIIACCTALLALCPEVSAQSFEDMVQSTLDADKVGSSLSRGMSFAMRESPSRHGAFDKPAPDFHAETEADPEVAWFDPSIAIGAAKLSPDVKRKGLRLRIPVDGVRSDVASRSGEDDE